MKRAHFPILGHDGVGVPWAFVALHEQQALRNHGQQSLEELSGRGGLSWCELCAVVEDSQYERMAEDEARSRVEEHLEAWRNTHAATLEGGAYAEFNVRIRPNGFVIASSRFGPRDGEDHCRGNDLGDGKLSDVNTIYGIGGRIVHALLDERDRRGGEQPGEPGDVEVRSSDAVDEVRQRVAAELSELQGKCERLQAFIVGPIFRRLRGGAQQRLETQHSIMRQYVGVLAERLKHDF